MKRTLLSICLLFTAFIYSYGRGYVFGEASVASIVSVGEVTPAGTEELQGADDQPKVVFYPNPTRDFLNVKFSEKGQHLIRIYNMVGEQIMKKEIPDGDLITIDVTTLQKGMYFMSYELDGKIVTKTFSKEQ